MYLLTSKTRDAGVVLVVVLEEDNIDRIKQQDPVELKLSEIFKIDAKPDDIGITYLNAEDIETLKNLMQSGLVGDAFKFATRGWKFQPQRGDHDMGPTDVLEKVDA